MDSNQSTLIQWDIWSVNDKELLNLILGREGGKTTLKIIDEILVKPYNKNQLAKILNIDYNTVTHHIKIMRQHEYITEEQLGKSFYYHPSKKLFKSIKEYRIIRNYVLSQ